MQQKIKSFLGNAPRTEERPIGSVAWNSWKSRNLTYLLDKRTIRLVSGASLLFSAPKSQWIQVFQRIDLSSQTEDSLCEIVVSEFSYLFQRITLVQFLLDYSFFSLRFTIILPHSWISINHKLDFAKILQI